MLAHISDSGLLLGRRLAHIRLCVGVHGWLSEHDRRISSTSPFKISAKNMAANFPDVCEKYLVKYPVTATNTARTWCKVSLKTASGFIHTFKSCVEQWSPAFRSHLAWLWVTLCFGVHGSVAKNRTFSRCLLDNTQALTLTVDVLIGSIVYRNQLCECQFYSGECWVLTVSIWNQSAVLSS